MLVTMLHEIEGKLAACLALLDEHMELCPQIGEQSPTDGKFKASLDAAMRQARERAEMVKAMLEKRTDPARAIPEEAALSSASVVGSVCDLSLVIFFLAESDCDYY
jgi:hypothetical protein